MNFEEYLEDQKNREMYAFYRSINARLRRRSILRLTIAFIISLALVGAGLWLLANHIQNL